MRSFLLASFRASHLRFSPCVFSDRFNSFPEEERAAAYLEELRLLAKRVETNGVGWRRRRDGPSSCDGRTAPRLSSSITPVFGFNTFPHAPTARTRLLRLCAPPAAGRRRAPEELRSEGTPVKKYRPTGNRISILCVFCAFGAFRHAMTRVSRALAIKV